MSQADLQNNITLARKIAVNPQDIAISKEGIVDYNWPISHQELLDFGQELEHALAKFFRQYPDQDQILAYKIASKNFVTTICKCFQGEYLLHKSKQNNLQIDLPSDWQVWPRIFSGQAPEKPTYLKPLKDFQKPKSIFQKALNIKKLIQVLKKTNLEKINKLEVEGLRLGNIPEENLDNVIIATQRLPLISVHAQNIQENVYLRASQNYFSSVSDEVLTSALSKHQDLIDKHILEIIRTLYSARGLNMFPAIEAYLSDSLKQYISLINIHLQRLDDRKDLPRILWTGTGGHIWDSILRCAVKKKNGVVVAHDHGGGVPHLDHPEKGWVEMWSCDEFMTYSQEQAKTFKNFMHSWPNLDESLPDIIHAPNANQPVEIKNIEKYLDTNIEIKKIRIFSTIYSSQEGRGLPIYPHIPYIDWQARLIGYLSENGYDVSFKPHPESQLSTPRAYEDVLGAQIIEKSLEEMGDDFDLYIFDLSNTSVLQTALTTNKPVLIVDFGVMDWREDAFEIFKKRCGYVKGFYEGSRMSINWDEMLEQIKQAAQKSNNHEFTSTFYI